MKKYLLVFLAVFFLPMLAHAAPAAENPCFKINEIRLTGARILSRRKIRKLTREFIGLCAAPDNLNELTRNITNAYIEKGYITARVFIQPQNIASGVVEVLAME